MRTTATPFGYKSKKGIL